MSMLYSCMWMLNYAFHISWKSKPGYRMGKKATIKDVAAQAGVSVATVSRTIHRNGYVSKENELKVREAIALLGYEEKKTVAFADPAPLMHTAAHEVRSRVIAVVGSTSKEHTFMPRLTYALSLAANAVGFYTLYIAQHPDNANIAEIAAKALAQNVCGIIFTDFGDFEISQENKDLLLGLDVPVVILERAVCTELNGVRIDSKRGIYLACKYLYETGRRHLCYLTAPIVGSVEKERMDGFVEAAEDYGVILPSDAIHICASMDRKDCQKELQKMYESGSFPDAIVAWSDLFAITTRQFLYDHNVSVPLQTAIFGYDDFLASYTAPPLSSVRAPINEMASAAISIIRDNLENTGEFFARNINLTPNLVLRSST